MSKNKIPEGYVPDLEVEAYMDDFPQSLITDLDSFKRFMKDLYEYIEDLETIARQSVTIESYNMLEEEYKTEVARLRDQIAIYEKEIEWLRKKPKLIKPKK